MGQIQRYAQLGAGLHAVSQTVRLLLYSKLPTLEAEKT